MAEPTDHARRAYAAFLRGPVGTNRFAFGTITDVRDGVAHEGLLADFPAPQDNAADDFGIQHGGGFTVEISDEVHELGLADWPLELEDGDLITLEDDSSIIIVEY